MQTSIHTYTRTSIFVHIYMYIKLRLMQPNLIGKNADEVISHSRLVDVHFHCVMHVRPRVAHRMIELVHHTVVPSIVAEDLARHVHHSGASLIQDRLQQPRRAPAATVIDIDIVSTPATRYGHSMAGAEQIEGGFAVGLVEELRNHRFIVGVLVAAALCLAGLGLLLKGDVPLVSTGHLLNDVRIQAVVVDSLCQQQQCHQGLDADVALASLTFDVGLDHRIRSLELGFLHGSGGWC